ncbi:NUDIX hydrolase [Actinotalea sp. Marseille-Q4924]|uniref:NUDIX hydrolase n=1 Tax=Actinotalea sp. Marseille-Q4924 TaxID=2866571 RepID=UPI001CE3FEF1|nr:NUDIX domain-containing protein [Actinotalea sp. Marseille-Q4924]
MPTAAAGTPDPAEAFLDDLRTWTPVDDGQRRLAARYASLVRTLGPAALSRDGGPEHLTGSCWILTPDLSRVLLCFHRKGRFWVQTGGHAEAADTSLAMTALREAREESGIAGLRLVGAVGDRLLPAELDRHELGASFGRCRAHWDVGYVALAPADATPAVSDESEHVAWFDVSALPADAAPGLAERLRLALLELHARAAT